MTEFQAFPKIARYSREVVVTEKIDGTNACVFVGQDGEFLTGSRHRWITPDDDNYGFSRWAHDHKDELLTLGPGRHFGEWWGGGIGRGYGLAKDERRLSLFNVARWCLHGQQPQQLQTDDPRVTKTQDVLPPCVGLVPVLWRGQFDALNISAVLYELRYRGSKANLGYMRPEGVVVFHAQGGVFFKKTIENDELPKSLANKEAMCGR